MTLLSRRFNTDIDRLFQTAIGFDNMFDRLFEVHEYGTNNAFPPYNVTKQDAENYTIELALAGYSKEDIEVEVKEGTLEVRSTKSKDEKQSDSYIHRGIARRSFVRRFSLADDMVVDGADLTDGMLYVSLKRIIPEEKKPRLVNIGNGSSRSSATLLNE